MAPRFKRTSLSLVLSIIALFHIGYLRYTTGEGVGWFLTFTGIVLVFVVAYLYDDLKCILQKSKRYKE